MANRKCEYFEDHNMYLGGTACFRTVSLSLGFDTVGSPFRLSMTLYRSFMFQTECTFPNALLVGTARKGVKSTETKVSRHEMAGA
jgi:hypothetical protein